MSDGDKNTEAPSLENVNKKLNDLFKEDAVQYNTYDEKEIKDFMNKYFSNYTYYNKGIMSNLFNIFWDALKLANDTQAELDNNNTDDTRTKLDNYYNIYEALLNAINIIEAEEKEAREREEEEEEEEEEEKKQKKEKDKKILYFLFEKLHTDKIDSLLYDKIDSLLYDKIDSLLYDKIDNIHIYTIIIANLHIIIQYIYRVFKGIEKIEESSSIKRIPGGFRKKNNLKPTVIQSKEILGKIRRIYKVAGSRKEHIKYKGELISVSDYKKLVKQAKALKSQNKPATKPKAKPTAKPATKPKAKPASKSTTKTTIKSATKSKAK
jgi:hypothetical protein